MTSTVAASFASAPCLRTHAPRHQRLLMLRWHSKPVRAAKLPTCTPCVRLCLREKLQQPDIRKSLPS